MDISYLYEYIDKLEYCPFLFLYKYIDTYVLDLSFQTCCKSGKIVGVLFLFICM